MWTLTKYLKTRNKLTYFQRRRLGKYLLGTKHTGMSYIFSALMMKCEEKSTNYFDKCVS